MGGVELGQPAGRLEDHGVALDETSLVPEPPALMALAGQLLGRGTGLLELAVHAVDELLLARDLALDELLRHASGPHLPTPHRSSAGSRPLYKGSVRPVPLPRCHFPRTPLQSAW